MTAKTEDSPESGFELRFSVIHLGVPHHNMVRDENERQGYLLSLSEKETWNF
ncbi:MAG: hypothetical protein HZA07_08120 [Nitrospirae bacterium]|nr:hypothetical protein [Nitrospirota bacterium]